MWNFKAHSRVIRDGSKWMVFHYAGHALQKPARRNNPDSMIDYSFTAQDDDRKFASGTPKGRQHASGGIGVSS
jgi:hypothetical protein